MSERCGHLTLNGFNCMRPRGHEGEHDFRIRPDTPRTYTESELAAERAALLREAAEVSLNKRLSKHNTAKDIYAAILAIPTDQSALARVEAAARADAFTLCAEAMDEAIPSESTAHHAHRFRLWATKALQDRGREVEK